ncbi:MAG: hypothetical protein AABY08_03355, partial [Candidatus Thermoplasmatota archaeon]
MTRTSATARATVTKIANGKGERAEDVLVAEEPMEIRLDIPGKDGVVTKSLADDIARRRKNET